MIQQLIKKNSRYNEEWHESIGDESVFIDSIVEETVEVDGTVVNIILIKYMPHVEQNVIIWNKVKIKPEVTEHVGILLKHYLSCSSTFLNNAIQIQ
ncbi:hypothetical protein KSF78_0004607 [Schistosoma japonicum]|nr:hypothetical protein KSF78_0004607 [Schistosoma japonicum]